MDIRAKVSSLACQLGALGYPNTVDECRFKDGDCDVFLDVIKFLFEYYWDSIGNDVIRLNRKCIPASWVVHGCSTHEEEEEVVEVGQQRRIVVGLLFGDEQKRRESFRKMSRICRDVFDMKIPLGEDQFVRKGFVLKKLDIVLEILKHLRDIHATRVKKSKDMRNSATAASAKKKKNDGSDAGGKRASETREKNHLDDDGLHAPRKTPNDIISSDPAIFSFLNRFMDPFWVEDPVGMCTQNAMQEDTPVEFGEFLVGHPHAAMDDCTWLSDPSMHGHEATINPLFSSSPVSEEMTTLNDGISCLHQLEGRIRGALAVLQQVSMHCEH
ncbi:hypothetical protein PSENEW3_00004416 [Picochlorum sp. SENEW3]|nr:hypothetical protein PSENEW3_00004416 [Picochlorum sp. SENEW3]